GVDHTFIYTATAGMALPDNRAYEMVTPPQKNGAMVGRVFYGPNPGISQDGSRVIAPFVQCFGGAGSCTANRGFNGEPFAFTRTGGGWVATPLAPSATRFGANNFVSTSADAGTALFQIQVSPGSEDDWNARRPDGSFLDIGPVSPPSLGETAGYTRSHEPLATGDLSHVVWSLSADRAPSQLWPFDATFSGAGSGVG